MRYYKSVSSSMVFEGFLKRCFECVIIMFHGCLKICLKGVYGLKALLREF